MALETKEILSYLDIPESEVDSIDKLKENFEKRFIKSDMRTIKDNKELFGSLTGAYNEANKTLFKQVTRDKSIDDVLSKFELDKMNIGHIIKDVVPAIIEEKDRIKWR